MRYRFELKYPKEGVKMNQSVDFKSLIQRSKEGKRRERFKGSFLDYLEVLHQNPQIVKLSHKRIYDMVMSKGVEVIKTDEDPVLRRIYGHDTIKKYKFFKDFYGIEKVIMKIVRYLKSAAMQGEESRQVLYFVGPVGSGKSSIVELLKRRLEELAPIYVLEDCPMREEPLHLIPKNLRSEFEELLGVEIEGELCPHCQYRLENEFDGDFEKFPVLTEEFSILSRKGVGVVPPVDPNNQDTSVLIGSVDISKLDLYAEDDPRVFSLNGAFNVGNRGLVEFIEVFKNDVEYLHSMITATQEKAIPSPGKGAMIYFDGLIIAHSNEAEWNKFKSDHTNEAILDRIVRVKIPYCLKLSEEEKIYQKLLNSSKFDAHMAPHTIKVAAMFAILSRLGPSNKVDPITKLKLYNGEEIVEQGSTKKVDVMELKEEASGEGMEGMSPRFISKCLDDCLSEAEDNCISPLSVLEALIKAVKELTISEDDKKRYLEFLHDDIKKEYNKLLEKEVTKAFIVGYKEQAEQLFNNYLDHAEAFVNKTKIKDLNTGEELEADEEFLKSIEEQIGISGTSAKGFRQDVTAYMFALMRKGAKIDYDSYEPLKEAIEKKLIASVKELSRIITQAKVRDKEQREKYDAMVEEMKRNGYCDHCCNVILKYAANNLWKD